MESLVFLMVTTAKNTLKELRKKPAQLAIYGLLAFALISTFAMSARMGSAMSELQLDNASAILQAGAFVVVLFLAGSYVLKGLDTGGSFFSMADVGLLFVSPVSPVNVLTYGMLKQAGTALFGGIAILAQAANLRNFFGLGPGGTFVVFFGYVISLIAAEGLAMLIYSLTNGRPARKMLVYVLIAAALLPAAFVAARGVLQDGLMAGFLAAGISPFVSAIPIAGWTAAGIGAFVGGNYLLGIVFFGLNILLFAAAILLLRRHGSDYYEDVLVATERSSTLKAAQDTGNVADTQALRRKVRVWGTGLFGWGASAIMGRQLREMFRLHPLKLIDTYSLSTVAMAGIMAYVNRSLPMSGALVITFFTTAYMQMAFMTMNGPVQEFTQHYIFLIPEKGMQKLLWNNGAAALKALLESILAYGVVGIILALPLHTTLALILCSFCFCLMLFSINIWGLRFFGTVINRGIMLIAYLLIAIVAMLPGIFYVAAIILIDSGLLVTMARPFLALAIWEFLMMVLFTFWTRKILYRFDMIKIEVRKR